MNDMTNISWPGWEIVRKIGSGSFGSVFEIQRDVFGEVERAALKVIRIPQSRSDIDELLNEGYDEASVTERFRGYLQDIAREYSMMAKMKGHTNVVYCDDIRYIQHDDGIGWDIYIKMELLTPMMSTLSSSIPEETAIRVGKDICSALILCKQQSIVHRDIKPQNIFVSANGEYKLGDFGIAKTAEKTTGGTKIGTYKYMAPEVYNNQPYGAAADIYSLGLVMYWLLNARRSPFLPLPPQVPSAGAEEDARRRRFAGEPIPAPAHGSPALQAIVLKACAYNPKERYATPDEMLADLKALDSGRAPAAAVMPPVAVPQPLREDAHTVSARPSVQKETNVPFGVFHAQPAPVDTDATVGTWNTVPKAPAANAVVPPAPMPAPQRVAPVAAPAAPKATPMAPPAAPKAVPTAAPAAPVNTAPAMENRNGAVNNTNEKKAGKKAWIPFAGIGAAVVLLVVILIAVFSGGNKGSGPSGNKPEIGGNNSQSNNNTSSGSVVLDGDDIFNGERFSEMVWGYYEADCYEYNGSNEDAKEFLTDIKYITVPTDRGDFEVAVLPLSIQSGKYSHFTQSLYYEGHYYDLFTDKGKAVFRKAYIAEHGDMTEAEFNRIETLLELDVAELMVADKTGRTYRYMLAYKIEQGKLALYELGIDDQYNITIGTEPMVQYDFLLDGSKLTLAYEGVTRNYLASGYKESDSSLTFSGYALNAENKYEDLEGFSFFQFGKDDDPSVYVDLSNGGAPVDPIMEFDSATGRFTLSWQERWTVYNGYTIKEEDQRSISGIIVPCTNYGFTDYTGFFLFIDGNRYHYLMSSQEYDELQYGDLLDESVNVEDLNESQLEDLAETKNSILEELNNAFRDAGINASIDPASGKVTLEASFLFATNSAELSAEGKAYLNGFLDVYSAIVLSDSYSGYISSILIEGHTDTSGSYSLNQTLSEQRASTVATHCIERNPALANVIQAKGCSYDFPVYNADGTVNMAESRRVTFRFILSVD